AQKLLGTINWVRPMLGITSEELSNLFNVLKGDPDLTSPQILIPAAKEELNLVSQKISTLQAHRRDLTLPVDVYVIQGPKQPFAIIGQHDKVIQKILYLE
ncbi:POK11 protein, partial [Haliaeetus albicilla]|nr:POK11 protein [Haliaeetus albicilla]